MWLNKTYAPADANLTGFASNVTGATFTLAANDSGDNLAHQVSIRNDSATDHSGKTVTLVGTDEQGRPLTEVVAAPGTSATVESTGYFLTLTSATPSATIGADTFDIGWVDEFVTGPVALNWRGSVTANQVTVTGTIDYDLELTNCDLQAGQTAVWAISDTTNHDGATASQLVRYEATPRFIRAKINSYSSGATISFELTQHDV